ncbi:hypothetical protein H4R18_005158 [Coemansia javaensis]|uniref:DUF1899 domain-containing protein n=1 Tax=Coemansia javaensis TaxID=2761396 RepID=A0A9W8LF94_9FUNG|nr:hypothetical protein H4R18_005158 [Coemansia javaensis]
MRLAKFSRFRNAAAALPARAQWHSGLHIDAALPPGANGLASDAQSLYIRAAAGNALHAVPLSGPAGPAASTLSAMPGRIVDWNAAVHGEGLVAAADDQGTIAVWRDREPLAQFAAHASPCATACFHPTVAGVVATSAAAGEIALWDINPAEPAQIWSAAVGCGVASVAPSGDGRLLAASTDAGACVFYDPRAPGQALAGSTPVFYAPGRPARVLWLGESPVAMTTGAAKSRERVVALWDQRALAQPLATLRLQPSTKPLIPLYDEDTQLAYLTERGDAAIRWVDADPSSAAPLAELGSVVLPAPTVGCALLPKPQLRVMAGEIARIYVSVATTGPGQGGAVVPIPHIAPRRTYLDFHSDLFPDTRAPLPAQSLEQWMAREPARIPRMSLDPANAAQSLAALRRTAQGHARFKYLEGHPCRPSEAFTNIRNVNTCLPQQNDPMRVSPKYIAVSCSGAGGPVGILRRDSPGRAPDRLATVIHGADIVDIAFDPFDPAVVATAGADGRLQMWRIPDELCGDSTAFELEEALHIPADRIHQIRFHPCAKGVVAVLASNAGEYAVHVYSGLALLSTVGSTGEGIHAFEWSPDGDRIAVTTRDSRQLRIYDARTGGLLAKGPAMDSARPCRIAWLGASRICLAGFGPEGRRHLVLHDAGDPAAALDRVAIDPGPGLLAPIADPDCGIVYLDERGSRLTHAYEVVGSRLAELPKFESLQPSLGLAALPKRYANVAQCELLRFYRLGAQALEPLGFRVPRKRPEFFQDDVFPDTVDTEAPSVDTQAWLDGAAPDPTYISLQPAGMTPLSEAPPEAVRKRIVAAEPEQRADNTKDAITAMLSRVEDSDGEPRAAGDPASGSDWDD